MARLEDLTRDALVKGIVPNTLVKIIAVKWHGTGVVELTYSDPGGHIASELLYRDREPALELATSGLPWSFDAAGGPFRLVSEAYRIHLAHLFDPLLAVHTSLVEPLPHQITAVYGEMLTRQPLRFLLADDPGAGKTIMTGLFIKELLIRGDLKRCLIVCPGSLVEQWQDELDQRFHLPFEILSNERIESARSGNAFAEMPLCIARLDKLSRDEAVQARLEQIEWDLVVVDEAHKMSATFFGGEVKSTKRYLLGRLLGQHARHFLLLTATPHNGKEEDFQLFMALLDGDRFEGKFRDGVHAADASDLLRHLVKEQLVKFDGTPLFPERLAYTVTYTLSEAEASLYKKVTEYVRDEFNRADALENTGRRGTVGFALTILQRRLASSPEAIYQSLKRRRERLEGRLREERLLKRGGEAHLALVPGLPALTDDDLDDLDDAPDAEIEATEDKVVDQATAACTIAELEQEITGLRELERLALVVRRSETDRKWEELSRLLQNNAEMFDTTGARRKLVIFTEHRYTLTSLAERIRSLLGRSEAVVTIHGGLGREERKKAQEEFIQDPEVQVLVATDAAGEGINLQRAHLMVNYDLPWNPNRLEQRFGRIHRIGQTEVCHLWNLVAAETREGAVFQRLFEKLEEERKALGGRVFDVLGKVTFNDRPLRELILQAIRYGDSQEVRARLTQVVDAALDRQHLEALLAERALASDVMDADRVRQIREEMERAAARRLQPHFIATFFREAFKLLGGRLHERETGRYELTHVPHDIRNRDRLIGIREAVVSRYERITFQKELVSVAGKPPAAFVCPGHPLLEATIDLILERSRSLLKQGAILVDSGDPGEELRALFYLEHTVQDGRTDGSGNRRIVSRQVQFVEIGRAGTLRSAGYAPYLDYRPLQADELPLTPALLETVWLKADLEDQVRSYAVAELVPRHVTEVRQRREKQVDRTVAAVKERLTKEIIYWDHRAQTLKAQEAAGKVNARLNSSRAQQRANELEARLRSRMEELEQERRVSALPPVVIGGALIVPAGLLARLTGTGEEIPATHARDTVRVKQAAMAAVMAAERRLGFEPRDVSADKCGYDIESRIPETGRLRFIEVKGRIVGAKTVTITKNEILTAFNKPDDWILALVEVPARAGSPDASMSRIAEERAAYTVPGEGHTRYVRKPFGKEPDFGVTSVNYNWQTLWEQGETSPGPSP